jgi:hypothetical protein
MMTKALSPLSSAHVYPSWRAILMAPTTPSRCDTVAILVIGSYFLHSRLL